MHGIFASGQKKKKKTTPTIPLFTSSKTYPEFPVVSFPSKILLPSWEIKSTLVGFSSSTCSGTLLRWPLSQSVSSGTCYHLVMSYEALPTPITISFTPLCGRLCVGSFYTHVHMEARSVHMEHVFFYALCLVCKDTVAH